MSQSPLLTYHLLLALVASFPPLPWMQAPTPMQSQPLQLQLTKYLLARHASSVLCIASTSFCFPDLTALQSNPNLPGRDFFFPYRCYSPAT